MTDVITNNSDGRSHEEYSGKTPYSSVLTTRALWSPAPKESVEPAKAYPPSDIATTE